jgi:hypothetical protein
MALSEAELDEMTACPCKADVLVLVAEVRRLNKVADWLAEAAANSGFNTPDGFPGLRRGPDMIRQEAEREVGE